MRAICYARWSSLEQQRGSSPERQHEATQRFCDAKGWEIAERLTDSGKSAWTGENIRTGELGKFKKRIVQSGGEGVVLVVEKLDRLSRQPPLVMAGWIQEACASGLTIATADGSHFITADALLRNNFTVMGLIFEAFRGFEESQTKSERVADAWSKKRASGNAMTAICPAWLRVSGSTSVRSDGAGKFEVIEDRAAIVRRIFDLTESGQGKSAIARTLNSEGVPVFGRGNGWHASYIQKITRNRAVIGEYQPHTKPRGQQRKPAGEPIRDYFPSIIDIAQFERVNDDRATRVLAQQGAGNRLSNLLSGLTQCLACGASMTLLNKGRETLTNGATVPRQYLKCSNAHRHAQGCPNGHSFNYSLIENAVLDRILHRAMDDQHFAAGDDVASVEADVLRLKRLASDNERRQRAAMAMVEDDPDDELAVARYRQLRGEARDADKALKAAKKALAAARGAVSPAEHVRRVDEVRALLASPDEAERYEARSRIKLALNDIIETVTFSGKKRRAVVILKGSVRSFVIDSAGNVGGDIEFTDQVEHSDDAAVIAYRERA